MCCNLLHNVMPTPATIVGGWLGAFRGSEQETEENLKLLAKFGKVIIHTRLCQSKVNKIHIESCVTTCVTTTKIMLDKNSSEGDDDSATGAPAEEQSV